MRLAATILSNSCFMKLKNHNVSPTIYAVAGAVWLSVCGAVGAATIFSDVFSTDVTGTYASGDTKTYDGVNEDMNIVQTATADATTKTFSAVTLANTGDYLELTFDLSYNTYTGGGMRYGFFRSDGNGYAGNIGTPGGSGSAGSSGFVQDAFGVNGAGTFVPTGWSNVSTGMDADTAQTMLLRITRNASDGLDLLATWSTSNNGVSVTTLNHTVGVGDLSAGGYVFDRIAFVSNNGGTGWDYDVDNVTVTTNIPEPGSLVLLAMSGLLALRRRR